MQFIEYCPESEKQNVCKYMGYLALITWLTVSCGSQPPPGSTREHHSRYC